MNILVDSKIHRSFNSRSVTRNTTNKLYPNKFPKIKLDNLMLRGAFNNSL